MPPMHACVWYSVPGRILKKHGAEPCGRGGCGLLHAELDLPALFVYVTEIFHMPLPCPFSSTGSLSLSISVGVWMIHS